MITEFVSALTGHLPAVPIYLGDAALDENARPPRLVVVPVAEEMAPPTGISWPTPTGKPIYARRVRLALYIWAESWAEVEGALAEVLTAIRKLFGPIATPERGEWVQGGAIAYGVAYRLELTLTTPVEEARQYVILESLALTCA